MYVVYVLDKDGNPLMPTKRFGHVRKLMKAGLAKPVSTKPFVIQLLYESTKYTQPLYGGTDPGRTNIGEAVINQKGEVVFSAILISRNKDIPKLMRERALHRHKSRHGERLRRKRRAKKFGTTTNFPNGRRLPGYENGILELKDIINSESRFINRRKPLKWITPTIRQCIQTHISIIKLICKILPITDWTIEYNKFISTNNNTVIFYGAKKAIIKNKYINDLSLNMCNTNYSYAGISILNIALPYIYENIKSLFTINHVHICKGKETYAFRKNNNLNKTHFIDAICIAAIGMNIKITNFEIYPYEIRQFRNHNRAIINNQHERTYKLKNKIIAKNRNPRTGQDKNIPALSTWFNDLCKRIGYIQARKILSILTVKKSTRAYNNLNRILPGAIFIYNSKRYILSGNRAKNLYFRAYGYGTKDFLVRKCIIIKRKSLVYI